MSFLPAAIVEFTNKRNEIDYRSMINLKQYLFLILTLLAQVIWQIGLIYASLNTI
jgi:hypothetical protein